MPRQARIDYPGALHHVIGRGIERKFIFKGDEHKREFYRRIARNLSQYSIQCYAWCIMGNHFHLLLQSGKSSIADFMRSVLTGYAVYYNLKYKRSGHLFQNRYKSVLCDKDEYLLALVRYIHLNPVRANMIEHRSLEKYSWTGHQEICRGEEGLIQNKDEILGFYGRKRQEAIQSYKKFIKDGVGLKEDFEGGGLLRSAGGLGNVLRRKKEDRELYDERILGNGQFVEDVLERIGDKELIGKKIKNIDDLLGRVSKYYQIPKETIIGTRQKGVREARDVVVYMGREYMGKSITEMGKILGIRQNSASDALRRGWKLKNRAKIEKEILK